MKIVRQTLTILTLQERPIAIWGLSMLTASLGLLIFLASISPIDYFGLFCILCANLMMFSSPVKVCEFDKPSNLVTLKQKGWLGTQIINCRINEIKKVHVEPLKLIGIQFYRLRLNLLKGKQLYLTPIPSTDWKKQEKLALHIQDFLSC
jgi:hypothetical protein